MPICNSEQNIALTIETTEVEQGEAAVKQGDAAVKQSEAANTLDRSVIEAMRVPEIRAELQARGLDATGKKKDLVSRLYNAAGGEVESAALEDGLKRFRVKEGMHDNINEPKRARRSRRSLD